MSEKYIVSARKYRPATFDTVVGQRALTHTLKTAIASQRLAHAYLFCGPRGVGKTTCARIFAKAINCQHPKGDGEPCNECESCAAFNEQRSYNIMELDAASNNSVEDIHTVIKQVQIPPQVGRYRVFIIDEVHMLSNAAFNAFLKTLEEPPEYAIFILATTEKQKIIPTILSRCQIYDFARITVPDIVEQLERVAADQGIEAEGAALNVIAQKADGAMRDALSIFDQVAASSGGHITYQSALDNLNVLDHDYYFRLDDTFLTGDVPQALLIYKEIRDKGFDSQFFINGLAQHLRDLMVALTPATAVLLEMNDDVAHRHVEQAKRFAPAFYYRALDLCNTCDLNYRTATNKQFLVELTLIKLCQLLSPTPLQQPQQPALKKVAPAQQPAQQPAQPQVQPAVQPAVQPQPAPPAPVAASPATPSATGAAPRPVSRIMVNRQPAAAPAPAAAQHPPATTRRTAFTADDLNRAWQKYIDTHPREQLLLSCLRNSLPERLDDVTYRAKVESQAQVQVMETHMTSLLAFLRNEVDNDMLSLVVKINEGAPKPVAMTDREIVEDLMRRNPEFASMVKDLDLTLN